MNDPVSIATLVGLAGGAVGMKAFDKLSWLFRALWGRGLAIKSAEIDGQQRILLSWADRTAANIQLESELEKKSLSAQVDNDLIVPRARQDALAEAERKRILVDAEGEADVARARHENEAEKVRLLGKLERQALEQEYPAQLMRSSHESTGRDEPVRFVLVDSQQSWRQTGVAHLEALRWQNIGQIAARAVAALPPDAEVDDSSPRVDIGARIFDSAKDVSDAELQGLWGRLIAGEISRPGKFSLRTIEALRNMTSVEARQFTDVASFIETTFKVIIFGQRSGGCLQYVASLVDAGLLRPHRIWFPPCREYVMRYHSRALGVCLRGPGIMDAHDVSCAGLELLSIVDKKPNEQFFEDLISDFRDAGYVVASEPEDVSGS